MPRARVRPRNRIAGCPDTCQHSETDGMTSNKHAHSCWSCVLHTRQTPGSENSVWTVFAPFGLLGAAEDDELWWYTKENDLNILLFYTPTLQTHAIYRHICACDQAHRQKLEFCFHHPLRHKWPISTLRSEEAPFALILHYSHEHQTH